MATIPKAPKSDNVPRLNFQNQKTPKLNFQRKIGVYLRHIYGNVLFRVRYDLGSNENVFCVVELYYPPWANGIIVGIPRRVL